MPKEGEPENYILEEPHSPKAAATMPDTYEVIFPKLPMRTRSGFISPPVRGSKFIHIYRLYTDSTEFPPAFDPVEKEDMCDYIASREIWQWLQEEQGLWIDALPVELVRTSQLQRLYLRWQKFAKEKVGKPYAFCLTCCTPFTAKLIGTLQEGYCTPDYQTWICPECFAEHAATYGWKEI